MFALRARNLQRTYGTGDQAVHALAGVSVDIARQEFVSIMGPSGSGKSTLMHLLGLLDAPTNGKLQVMGQDASTLNANDRALSRRQNIGFVFQAFHLIPRASAIQNVMLPMALAGVPRRQRRPRAEEILAQVGLADRMSNRPHELSGGQKQRVAIARALALDPPIIMADEPTGNLDSSMSRDIMGLFAKLHEQGKTIVQVTHEKEMARYGQRILHVHDGRIRLDSRRGA